MAAVKCKKLTTNRRWIKLLICICYMSFVEVAHSWLSCDFRQLYRPGFLLSSSSLIAGDRKYVSEFIHARFSTRDKCHSINCMKINESCFIVLHWSIGINGSRDGSIFYGEGFLKGNSNLKMHALLTSFPGF